MEIRLAIIPQASISRLSGNLGKKYGSQYPHRFLVDNRKLFPHITLFKVKIAKKHYPALVNTVKANVQHSKAFPVKLTNFLISPGGWVALNLEAKSLIKFRQRLHSALTESGLALDPLSRKPYRPHITLTRFYSDRNAKKVVAGQPLVKKTMIAKTVGLCLSRQTQVYKILNHINLK